MAEADALAKSFEEFCKISGSKNGRMTNKAWNKMVKDTKVVDKKFTTTDTDILWSKFPEKKGEKDVDYKTFQKKLRECVAPEYKKKKGLKDDEEAYNKLVETITGGKAKLTGVTKQSKTGNVEKMTDTSQYTGAHKERFGADGKGKGIEGREDVAANDGYVGNYKEKGMYDEKH